ncbi:GNAT family N-acetyltransferase [Pseudoalteromonas xiamenensis]|uniref:GNAT family N-acetyltransferase n=1 Tax=Pseudoalteromonas xiamenensis TaxID=882626 RepID=UPI0035ED1D6B
MNTSMTISNDIRTLDVETIHDYLANQSYWAQGRTRAQVQQSIEHSMCFGAYIDGELIAFARVITDTVVFAYLLDVFVLENHQGKGVGKQLLGHILNHEKLQTVNWLLRTNDAAALYEKFGFKVIDAPETYLRKPC